MSWVDLIAAPVTLLVLLILHRLFSGTLTTPENRRFYTTGLYLKLFGAFFFVLIFLYYYGGGDTTLYYLNSSKIYDAFWDNPIVGFQILLSNSGEYNVDTYDVVSRIGTYTAAREWAIVKWGGLFSLFTLNSYLSITFVFAFVSFYGLWFMFLALSDLYPSIYRSFGYAIFYIPSIFFWSSGYLKEPICMLGLGLMFWSFYKIMVKKQQVLTSSLIFVWALYITMQLKPYIPLSFLPAALFWVFNENVKRIRSPFLRVITAPVLLSLAGIGGYFVITRLTAGDSHFDIMDFPERVKISADYLYRTSVNQGGSAYTLGELDGTWGSTLRLFPSAVVVSLFRPYLWEARNPVMLLAALEASYVLGYAIYTLFKLGPLFIIQKFRQHPFLQMAFVFSVVFAFAIGISTYNFGSLVRYKIPIYPFFLSMLFVLNLMKREQEEQRTDLNRVQDLKPEPEFVPTLR